MELSFRVSLVTSLILNIKLFSLEFFLVHFFRKNPSRYSIMLKKSAMKECGRRAKLALTTKEGFKNAIEVKTSDFAPSSYGFIWSNAHMDPTRPSERTWTWFHYFAVWYSFNFTSGAWATASSLLSLNLVWWQAILACLVGATISAATTCLNSRQSSVYHIGFPTLQRVSFGPQILSLVEKPLTNLIL